MNGYTNLIEKHFTRNCHNYSHQALVQKETAMRLIQLLPEGETYHQILEIGCGTGLLTEQIVRKYNPKHLIINDLSRAMLQLTSERIRENKVSTILLMGDAEVIPFPKNRELIISASTLQWFKNPALFFQRAAQSLIAGGTLAISTFGEQNLCEIKQLTSKGLVYPSMEALSAMIALHFDILHSSNQICQLSFASTHELLKHLQQTGVNGTNDKRMSPKELRNFISLYETHYRNREGNVVLTYHPMWIIAKLKPKRP